MVFISEKLKNLPIHLLENNMYAATLSDPDKIYIGNYKDRIRIFFKGITGYWVVWDDGIMNSPRLVIDDKGKPQGFELYINKDDIPCGYLRN